MNNYNRYFAYSRTAFKFGISLLKLSEGQEILFPNYLCEEILHPIKHFKITPVFYKIFDDFTPDWDDINKNISSKTRAIVAIHYFGKPQNLKKFKELCKIKNIFLIEDNAHGWGSKYQNQYLGTIGDIGFSSPRKTLETKTGGVLHLKNKKLKNSLNIPTSNNFFNFWSCIHYLKENVKQRKFFLHLLKNQPKYWDINGFNENELDDKFIDKYSLRYINNCNLSEIVEKRRKLYLIWEKFIITKTNLTPVFKTFF